jgi:hypothetical protein
MITYHDHNHLTETLVFAAQHKAAENLIERLDYLANYGDGKNRVEVFPDHYEKHCFEFRVFREDGTFWFNGGIICHDNDDGCPHWGIHT